MRVIDPVNAAICFLSGDICDVSVSYEQTKYHPHFGFRYIFNLRGDFIKYVKRV